MNYVFLKDSTVDFLQIIDGLLTDGSMEFSLSREFITKETMNVCLMIYVFLKDSTVDFLRIKPWIVD